MQFTFFLIFRVIQNLTLHVSVHNHVFLKRKVLEVIDFKMNSVNQKFDEFKTKIREMEDGVKLLEKTQ